MIKFIDKNTGNIFEGSYPYIFWFDGEQSVNIFYHQQIIFISDKPEVKFKLPKNNIFKLLDPKKLDDYYYNNQSMGDIHELESEDEEIIMNGYSYMGNYIYVAYIYTVSQTIGEFIENFYIDGNEYQMGADFYAENESLYINLSNNGVSIPEMVQKAFYPTNIHEDKRDNIIMNRKLKELLSNMWDIVANKGSYKSLINSLSWFEYGDLIQLNEVWKTYNGTHDNYQLRNILQVLSDKYFEELQNTSKSTYLSLNLALNKLDDSNGFIKYDDEQNPILKDISFKWSAEDLALKMYFLGQFYKIYFMPIHLDLIHSTIENIVFTNTIKHITGSRFSREDTVYYIDDCKCNIKNGQVFTLGQVECCVDKNTIFATTVNTDENLIVGVKPGISNNLIYDDTGKVDNQSLKDYVFQLYNHIGAIAHFEIKIPINDEDFIKLASIKFGTYDKNGEKIYVDRSTPIINKNGKLEFDLLCPQEGDYTAILRFDSASGNVYIKKVQFSVVDVKSIQLKLYKVKSKQHIDKIYEINQYMFDRFKNQSLSPISYAQYIPTNTDMNDDGVKLNHFMILKGNQNSTFLQTHYYTQIIEKGSDEYTFCISKDFWFNPTKESEWNRLKQSLYRHDYIFIPENHRLEEFGLKNELSDFLIYDQDTICVIPNLSIGKYIEESEWEFICCSPGVDPILYKSIKEPFIAPKEKIYLPKGYYDIKFRYKLKNNESYNELYLKSAFLKV